MNIKTNEPLTPTQINWIVAGLEGLGPVMLHDLMREVATANNCDEERLNMHLGFHRNVPWIPSGAGFGGEPVPEYTASWKLTGPILVKKRMGIGQPTGDDTEWSAFTCDRLGAVAHHDDPLIAILLCYIKSELEQAYVPEELCGL